MNSLVLLIVSIAVLVVGYIFYGGWLCRQWGVGENKEETPAHSMEDGVDYVPAKAPVLMGHHFSSIAGAGPITGSWWVVSSSEAYMILERFLRRSVIKASRWVRLSPRI